MRLMILAVSEMALSILKQVDKNLVILSAAEAAPSRGFCSMSTSFRSAAMSSGIGTVGTGGSIRSWERQSVETGVIMGTSRLLHSKIFVHGLLSRGSSRGDILVYFFLVSGTVGYCEGYAAYILAIDI